MNKICQFFLLKINNCHVKIKEWQKLHTNYLHYYKYLLHFFGDNKNKKDFMLVCGFKKIIFLLGVFSVLCFSNVYANDFNIREKLKDVNVYFSDEASKLYAVVAKGDLEKARNLVIEGSKLEAKGPATENQNVQQITLLSYSLGVNDRNTAKNFLSIGANPLVRPSVRNGNSFLFLMARDNLEMLNFLYEQWPMNKIDNKEQALQAFYAVNNKCKSCLELMFKHGMSPSIVDDRGYNIFMQALANEDFDLAWWLLSSIKISVSAEAKNGVTPANAVQFYMFKFPSTSVRYEQITQMKNYIEKNHNIKFPVETSLQIRKRKGLE